MPFDDSCSPQEMQSGSGEGHRLWTQFCFSALAKEESVSLVQKPFFVGLSHFIVSQVNKKQNIVQNMLSDFFFLG